MTTRFARAPAQAKAAPRVRHAREAVRARPRTEALADAAAAAVLGGRTNVAREVGVAPAASGRVAGSPGVPLGPMLRARLERGFGADLGALRVHTDTSAREAARAERARGFAAGPHVYLDLPAHALDSEAGVRLLSHEVAHVLQQTGRRDGAGRLRATEMSGVAEVQRDDDLAQKAADDGLFVQSPPSWADLVKAHGGAKPLGAHLTTLDLIIARATPAGAQATKDLESLASDAKVKVLPPAIRAFYVDAMKWTGAFDAARILLLNDPKLPTAFRSRPFYEHLRAKGLEWMKPLVEEHAFLGKYFPARFAAAYRSVFYGPGRPIQDLDPQNDPGGPFLQRVRARIDALAAALGTSDNELAAVALVAARELDWARHQHHERSLASIRAKNPTWTLPEVHQHFAAAFKEDPTQNSTLVPIDYPETVALYFTAATRIRRDAEEADSYWRLILDALNSAATGKVVGAFYAADAKVRLESIGTHRLFSKLGAALALAASKVLDKRGKHLPDAGTFRAGVEAARKTLLSHSTIYTAELVGMARTARPDAKEAILIGLVLWRIGNLVRILDDHATRVFETGDDRTRRDARVGTQILFARQLAEIGKEMKIDAAVRAADAFLTADAYLALLSDWEEIPNFGLKEFRALIKHHKDEKEIYSEEPATGITWAVFRQFIDAREFEVIADTLSAVKPVAGTPALAAGRAAAAQAYRPRQFVIKKHAFTDPRQASKPRADVDARAFSRELNANPLTVALKNKERKWDEIVIEPVGYSPTALIYLAFLPGMDRLMKVIHDRVGLQVEAAWQARHPGAPALRPEDWAGYLKALQIYVASLTEAEKVTHLAQVRTAMGSHLAAQRDRAYRAARKLASHDRRIAAAKLRSLWSRFDRWNPGTYHLGREALRTIDRYGRSVWPEEDRLTQVTTQVLETIAEMNATLRDAPTTPSGKAGDEDVIGAVWPLLSGAIDILESKTPTWAGQLPAADIVEMSGRSQMEVSADEVTLRGLQKAVAERAEALQRKHGIVAEAGGATPRIRYVGWQIGVSKGDFFEGRHQAYILADVHRSFTYYRPVFGYDTLGLKWPGRVKGDDLLFDENGREMSPDVELLTILRMAKDGTKSETLTVKGSDRAVLLELTEAMDWFTFFKYMEKTAAVVELIAKVLIEVAELIPGIGQGITLARFVTGVLDTLSSAEFRRLLTLLGDKGLRVITDMFAELVKILEPAELLEVILFEADFSLAVRDHPKIKNEATANQFAPRAGQAKTTLWTRMARVVKNVAQLGLRILGALKRITKKAQFPLRTTQMWILSHPTATMLLDLLSMGLDLISSMSIDQIAQIIENPEEGWNKVLASNLNQAAQEVVDRVRTIVDTLGHIELPRELVPVELIVDFFLEMVVNNVGGGKIGLLVKGGKKALELVGLWGRVIGVISDAIRVNGLDPNQFYRDEVVNWLQPKLEGVRAGFISDLLATLSDIPVLGVLAEPAGTPLRLDTAFTAADFPESNSSASSPPPVRRHVVLPAPAGGVPLQPSTRRTMERAWGHDLSHVRVHTGADAARVTSAFSAEGLTTGSHVYLRPGLSPGSERGATVLRHELAHVVQQTGPRPLRGGHGSTPSAGAPGRGLVWDEGREAEADRASHAAGSAPSSYGAAAVQPRLFSKAFIKRFLDDLGTGRTLLTARDEIEAKGRKTSITTHPLAGALKAAIDGLPQNRFNETFRPIHAKLKALTTALWPRVLAAMPVLEARAAGTPVSPPPGSEDMTPQNWVDRKLMQLELGRFLYALTGIAYEIELARADAVFHGKTVDAVGAAPRVESLKVVYFHPSFAEPAPPLEELWDELVKNSFEKHDGYSDPAMRLTLKIATKMVLGKGIQPNTYLKTKFQLAKGRIAVILNQVKRVGAIVDELAKKGVPWPKTGDYTNWDASRFTDEYLRELGLRVGTYKDWDWRKLKVPDRDPHHITQFLLVEYFYNRKVMDPERAAGPEPPKPFRFKSDTVHYPGVTGPGDRVDLIKGPDGTIDIEKLFPDRGGVMPIILIAQPAHQSGLHYKPSAGAAGGSSQRSTVNTTFRNALKAQSAPVAEALDQKAQVEALGQEKVETQTPKGVAVTPLEVKKAIVPAARETYRTLQSEMDPVLKYTLMYNEPKYYNLMAERLRSSERLTWSAIEPTYNKAMRDNKEVLEKYGFK